MPSRRRHVDYFAVMEALQQPGCPACRLADRAARRLLEALFYEQVTDPQSRRQLRKAGGFCREHTALVVKLGDALGSSIIYADLLREASESLRAGAPERCPACEVGTEAGQRCLSAVLAHLAEDEFRAAYERGDGLCLSHLGEIASRKSAAARDAVEFERARVVALAAECEEFVAKSDYRRAGEPMGPERDAWQRAARKLGGGCPDEGGR